MTIDARSDQQSDSTNFPTDTPDSDATESFQTLRLPVLPLPDGVILPEMVVTISAHSDEARHAIAAATDNQLLLVPRYETDGDRHFAHVGVIAIIEDRAKLPDGTTAITIRAQQRAAVLGSIVEPELEDITTGFWAKVDPITDPEPTEDHKILADEYRAAAVSLLERVGGRRLAGILSEIKTPGALADSVAYWPELSNERRITLLETTDVTERLSLASAWVKQALAEIEVQEQIQREVSDDLAKGQREAILRRQMAAIQSELDEGDDDAIAQYRQKLAAITGDDHLSEVTATAIEKEISRLERTGSESMESNWIRSWLDSVFEIPWADRTEDRLDLVKARSILDADHTGLDDVKERLVEFLAVRKLRAERAPNQENTKATVHRGGAILALVGPPGVGKTSLGESVANALGRKFVRVALGGIRDEAEIRGHRRTYVGARPGRLVRAMTEAGSMNPVILLDELDKVGSGWQGDPSAALLEVLDPAQNHSFRDHYLEFDLDLSDVVFIATANVLDTIPGPLLDRLEIISLDGYTEREKTTIAKDHLLPRLTESNALRADEVVVSDEVLATIASDYTREAGVRQLERLLDKVLRKSATTLATDPDKAPLSIEPGQLRELLGRPIPTEETTDRIDQPGIATGLAVTGAGGDVLFVETALIDGTGDPLLTGQLGDVMKESALLARSIVGARSKDFNINFPEEKRLHVHFPAGAIPKDGPSAGVTMTTALVSLLTGRTVRPEVAMTGEVTLQGRVLPVGGVKQKILAAHRAGISDVILPFANGDDLEDLPDDVLDAITVHLARTIDDVLKVALS